MSNDLDLSGVAPSDVAAVLNRAADLIDKYGWTPDRGPIHQVDGERRPAGRITALQAITLACDEVGGRGVDSAELHTASLDAVCLKVFDEQHGRGASVSRWERRVEKAAIDKFVRAQSPSIAATLREAVPAKMAN
jgi:hypothetical protein